MAEHARVRLRSVGVAQMGTMDADLERSERQVSGRKCGTVVLAKTIKEKKRTAARSCGPATGDLPRSPSQAKPAPSLALTATHSLEVRSLASCVLTR